VALGVPFSQLVSEPSRRVQVVRAGEGRRVRAERADFTGTLLAAGSHHARRDVYVIELGPGAVRDAAAHTPGSVEHLVVAAGRLRAGPADAPVELAPGDYLSFPGDAPTGTRHWLPAPGRCW
jgi:mannose-6-phosphate isomerase-like protein (cupin superfamily)